MVPNPVENEDIYLEVDCTNTKFVPKPLEGIARQKAEEYLENLKKYHPEEYEQFMKDREPILKEREGKKKEES